MAFLTEPEPPRGVATQVLPGIRRIVAANPSVMTYHGTNTWLIEGDDGTTVLDPGPDDPDHLAAILREAGPIARIVLSHTHRDHFGNVAALKAATSAPTWGFRTSADAAFAPDHPLDHLGHVGPWQALHTPGHAADHLCFARADGVVFTADHVMSWSSSIVSPPKGNMAAYFASLRLLLDRDDDRIYLPGHGPMLTDPRPFVQDMLAHREKRERAILAALDDRPATTVGLVASLYSKIDPILKLAAERNVIAHLEKLAGEGRAVQSPEGWRSGPS